jgi:hypothetical protein
VRAEVAIPKGSGNNLIMRNGSRRFLRRDVIAAAFATAVLPVARSTWAMGRDGDRPINLLTPATETTEGAVTSFPYEIVRVPGADAYSTWQRLKGDGRSAPVVVGDDRAFDELAEWFSEDFRKKPLEEVLSISAGLHHPQDLYALREKSDREADESLRQQGLGNLSKLLGDQPSPPEGMWPEIPPRSFGLSIAVNEETGSPYESVNIAILPTEDPATIPAYLRWGGWNDNPLAEYHVAALRSWRDRYGAELAGISRDTMNIIVSRRPQTRAEALALAKEQYAYCDDIIDQGYGTFNDLAASLLANDWWYFWWD